MNDKLREALNAEANYIDALGGDSSSYRQALAASKPEPLSENCVSVAMSPCQFSGLCKYCKPEPQAQAGEPEVVASVYTTYSGEQECDYWGKLPAGRHELITLRSHREAMEAVYRDANENAFSIAKKDAALDACVEAGKAVADADDAGELTTELVNNLRSAITQAQEAMR